MTDKFADSSIRPESVALNHFAISSCDVSIRCGRAYRFYRGPQPQFEGAHLLRRTSFEQGDVRRAFQGSNRSIASMASPPRVVRGRDQESE